VVTAFIAAHKDRFGVEPICRVLSEHGVKVAPSTYYASLTRPASARSVRDAELIEHIERIFWDRRKGRGVSGARKMWRLLAREDIRVARCTVERLMRQQGLSGIRRGKRLVTTRPHPEGAVPRPPDLVEREFTATAPNQLWVVDFTYVPTWSGMGFTAFVTDVYSRRIVGWRTTNRMPTELPLDALEMALWVRDRAGETAQGRLNGLIHHSDAGSQYTALRYSERLVDAGALASIGSVGDSFDNAMAESVIGLYKTECVKIDGPFRTVDELELATLSWVHWFNENRLHSSIDYKTPLEAEQEYYRHNQARQQPLSGELTLH
jgi:putative transposase